MELNSFEDLNEKSIEIILNFKPQEKHDRESVKEIQKLKEDIKKTISLLSKQEQDIIKLRYFENLPISKITQVLGKQEDEITKLLLSAINNIKEKIHAPTLNSETISEKVKIEQPESIIQKTIQPSAQAVNKRKSVMWANFIGFLIFILVFSTSFYFIYKMLSGYAPSLNLTVDKGVRLVDKKTSTATIDPRNIKISGSTSLLALSRRWENAFSIEYPKYKISLVASDSDKGISALIQGKVDIANSSRPLNLQDQNEASLENKELAEHRVALDALIVVVNKKNPVKELDMDNLEQILNGKIKNWQTLGGDSYSIVPVIREKGSGTNNFIIYRILQGEKFSSKAIRKKSNEEILKFISQEEGAIGFVNSTNYEWNNPDIKYLLIKNYPSSTSVSPFLGKKLDEDALRYGDYPLTHYLYLITLVNMSEKIQDFVDWILSLKGQEIVRYSGLVPVIEKET